MASPRPSHSPPRRRRKTSRLALAGGGALLVEGLLAGLRRRPPGGAELWARRNHRGDPVSLLAGPALAGAVTTTAYAAAGPGLRIAALVATAASGAVGVYDDLAGSASGQAADKGFAGHLAALRRGRVSAGMVKLAVVGLAGLAAGRRVGGDPLDRIVAGGVVAGTANLLNLLDLRPGRAIKVAGLVGLPLLAGPHGALLAGPLGAAGAVLRRDLGEEVMLGDGGANCLGAAVGLRLALAGGASHRCAVLAVLVALTAASEKVSFTEVIAATPGLRELDALGRRPAAG